MNPFLVGAGALMVGTAGAAYLTKQRDTDVLARTVWGEARGDGRRGMEAVAAVIMNRFRSGKWFAEKTIAATAMKAYQFSVWIPSDPNYRKLLTVDEADPMFAVALEVARDAIAGKIEDPTGGATHYHAKSINRPPWAAGAILTADIGGHVFYRGVA